MAGADSFHSLHEIVCFLERKPDALKDIVFELRNMIVAIAPHATEKIMWGEGANSKSKGDNFTGIGIYFSFPVHIRENIWKLPSG